MSSAEPFMPAHEPASPASPREHDIDHDTDVLFDRDETEAEGADPQPWHTDGAAPTLPRPVPGDHLTADALAADLAADDETGEAQE